MHELAITQSVVDAVVERVDGAGVRTLTLEIGRLSGVVADSVRFCFDWSPLERRSKARHWTSTSRPGPALPDCGADFTLEDLILLCPCGSADVEVTAGRELDDQVGGGGLTMCATCGCADDAVVTVTDLDASLRHP